MILTLVLIVVLLILSFLLLARIRIRINTDIGVYMADYGRWVSVRLMKKRRNLVLRLRLLFINMYLAPWKNIRKKDPEPSGVKRRKRPGKKSFKRIIRLSKVMYASLAIKRLRADIDTGDFPLNAQLIPLALLINGGNRQLSINFEDRNELEVTIQTRLIKIIWKYFTIHN